MIFYSINALRRPSGPGPTSTPRRETRRRTPSRKRVITDTYVTTNKGMSPHPAEQAPMVGQKAPFETGVSDSGAGGRWTGTRRRGGRRSVRSRLVSPVSPHSEIIHSYRRHRIAESNSQPRFRRSRTARTRRITSEILSSDVRNRSDDRVSSTLGDELARAQFAVLEGPTQGQFDRARRKFCRQFGRGYNSFGSRRQQVIYAIVNHSHSVVDGETIGRTPSSDGPYCCELTLHTDPEGAGHDGRN